ncbi:mersacidin/lichenicidin family type 2 lantibiotic [Micromonospora sp. CPCC 205371]|nr:mersacidin/lichenicidin family type 2 lantibiotic [Micromonospora sp. CPCC 205371]
MDHVKAWKDPVYRASLAPQDRNGLAPHPAGAIQLADDELTLVAGGALTLEPCASTWPCPTFIC